MIFNVSDGIIEMEKDEDAYILRDMIVNYLENESSKKLSAEEREKLFKIKEQSIQHIRNYESYLEEKWEYDSWSDEDKRENRKVFGY